MNTTTMAARPADADAITVARTATSTVLMNVPRDVSEMEKMVPRKSWLARLFS